MNFANGPCMINSVPHFTHVTTVVQ